MPRENAGDAEFLGAGGVGALGIPLLCHEACRRNKCRDAKCYVRNRFIAFTAARLRQIETAGQRARCSRFRRLPFCFGALVSVEPCSTRTSAGLSVTVRYLPWSNVVSFGTNFPCAPEN
jgi:hypothetical protein